MPGTTEAIAFTDSYKHMECLCGMRLQSFTLFTRATPGTPASIYIYIYIYTYIYIYIFSACMMVFLFLQHRDSGISRHSNKHERITRVQVKAHVRTYVSFVGRTHVHTGHGRRRVIHKNARIMNNAKFETICLTAFINPMKKLCHCSEIYRINGRKIYVDLSF